MSLLKQEFSILTTRLLKSKAGFSARHPPTGKAFCIFFGSTPVSQGDEIRPASAVTVFGKVIGDAGLFKQVVSGTEITIEPESSG